jgi:hypothetical protein
MKTYLALGPPTRRRVTGSSFLRQIALYTVDPLLFFLGFLIVLAPLAQGGQISRVGAGLIFAGVVLVAVSPNRFPLALLGLAGLCWGLARTAPRLVQRLGMWGLASA